MNWTPNQLYNTRCTDPDTGVVHRGVYYQSADVEGWYAWCVKARYGVGSLFIARKEVYVINIDTVSPVTCLACPPYVWRDRSSVVHRFEVELGGYWLMRCQLSVLARPPRKRLAETETVTCLECLA